MIHPHNCTCGAHGHAPHVLRTHAARKDPTRTTGLRIRFEQEVNRRFRRLKNLITEAIVGKDVFGIKANAVTPSAGAFAFARSGEKVDEFMAWLRRAEEDELLSITPGTPVRSASQRAWTNVYIDSAYQKGLASAATNLGRAGVEVSDRWLDSAFFRPVHADKLGLIYTRVYSDLAGITDAMDVQISRILAQGIGEGRGAMSIARDINRRVDGIGRTRARMLARTEVVSAASEASLNAYKEAGLEGVTVQAEWSTAGDDQVCEECADMEGKTFSMDEATGMIPLHPNCRCAWLPVVGDPEGLALR